MPQKTVFENVSGRNFRLCAEMIQQNCVNAQIIEEKGDEVPHDPQI